MKTRRRNIGVLVLSLGIFVWLLVTGQFSNLVNGLSDAGAGQKSFDSQEDCPVTQPQKPAYVPPIKFGSQVLTDENFWYGDADLWTLLKKDGVWDGLPYHEEDGGHYFNKVVWWNKDYDWHENPKPNFTLTAYRLDDPAVGFESSEATNAYEPSYGSMIMTGVELATAGCWQITGQYEDAQLSFVVWVSP